MTWLRRLGSVGSPLCAMVLFPLAGWHQPATAQVAPTLDVAVVVRAGNHADFGRLVVDAPLQSRYTVARDGDRVLIRFGGDITLAPPAFMPRNVSDLHVAHGQLNFAVPRGARLRHVRLGDRVVIDIADPMPDLIPLPPAPVTPAVQAAAKPTQPGDDPAFVVPARASTGMALFRRGAVTYLVLDDAAPVAPSLQPGSGIDSVSVHTLPDATVFRLRPAQGGRVSLTRVAAGWRIDMAQDEPRTAEIAARQTADQLMFAVPDAGRVVAIADPDNGAPLLVGTVRQAGHGVMAERRTGDFILAPSDAGVVIEALSDRLALRQDAAGFVLTLPPR